MGRSASRRNRDRGEAEQLELIGDPRVRRGRTERAADAYLRGRRVDGSPVDPLAAAMLREAARDRDLATLAHDGWLGAAASRALRDTYLVVAAGEAATDEFAAELAALLAPAVGDAGD